MRRTRSFSGETSKRQESQPNISIRSPFNCYPGQTIEIIWRSMTFYCRLFYFGKSETSSKYWDLFNLSISIRSPFNCYPGETNEIIWRTVTAFDCRLWYICAFFFLRTNIWEAQKSPFTLLIAVLEEILLRSHWKLKCTSSCLQSQVKWIQRSPVWMLWASPDVCLWSSLTPSLHWRRLCCIQTPVLSSSPGRWANPAVAHL